MGWLTPARSTPTLKGKAKKVARGQVDKVKRVVGRGNCCVICDRPLASSAAKKSNTHPHCAWMGGHW